MVIAGTAATRHNHRVRWLALSIVVHLLALMWLARQESAVVPPSSTARAPLAIAPPQPIVIEMLSPAPGGSSPPAASARTTPTARRARSGDAWEGVAIRQEGRDGGHGSGQGHGYGAGTGHGIGFGDGGGVQSARDVPAPPVPVETPPSKARPAKLIWPTRDEEVEDEVDLFVARITVDEEGSVVGARMVKTRPGSRGDDAANAIWRFRYLPALDDSGAPIRSTFEQPFQVR